MLGKIKAIITRNFLNKRGGKYCVCKFGDDPKKSIEVSECVAVEAVFVRSSSMRETGEFHSFGCGLVCVALVDESLFDVPVAPEPVKAKTGKVEFDGNRFRYVGDRSYCDSAKEVKFGTESIEVVAA